MKSRISMRPRSTKRTWRAGSLWRRYYGTEALRQVEWSAVNADLRLADLVLRWCLHSWKGQVVSLPDLYQLGPNSIRVPDVARRIVAVLVKNGHLAEEPGPVVVNGKRRREAWRIVGKQSD